MAKKRNKKYKPKPVRTPVALFKVWPELSEGQRAELDVHPLTHIDAIRRGEGTVESAWEVQGALRHAWILSQGFEEQNTMRMAFLLAFASLNAVAKLIERGGEIPEPLFDPIYLALDYFQGMKDSLNRVELIKSMRATIDSGRIYCIADRAAFYVGPKDDDWHKLLGRRGCAVLNGKVRSGYLNLNKEMGNRLEWISPTEDWLTIPIHRPFVLLLTEPLTKEEANQ